MLPTLWAFLQLGRPLFLAGGFLLHGLGVAIALYDGAVLHGPTLLWGQVAVTAIQWMTHYSNEYFDLAADRANPMPTRWSGGSRVLPEGRLSPSVALTTAWVLTLVALAAALVLAVGLRRGPLTLPLLVLAWVLAWGYSASPLRLHSRGLGELTIALLVPGLTPLVGYYLHTGRLAWLPLLAAAPLCALQFAQVLSIEFADAPGDTVAGKRTLVVRLGARPAARLQTAAVLAAYLALPLVAWAGLPWPVAVAMGLSAPLAAWQVGRLARGDWARHERHDVLASVSIALLMGTAALALLAFIALDSGLTS